MLSNSCVYWIHLPEHTDILTQGYVGVSHKGAEYRFKEHLSLAGRGSKLPVHSAIRKYGNKLLVDTVIQGDIDYCYLMEVKLRPEPCIGYNICPGGEKSVLGRKNSDETKAKMSASAIARGQRPNQKALDNSAKTNSQKVAWLCKFSDKEIWLEADRVYEHMKINPTHGIRKIGTRLGLIHTKLQVMYKKIKSGWNPSRDAEWLIFSGKLTPDTLEISVGNTTL